MAFRSLLLSELQKFLYCKAVPKMVFADGKATDKIESTVVKGYITSGEVQFLLPPEEGLDVRLNSHFKFGDVLEVDDIFDISDTKISIYNGELTVKFDAELKEGIL